MSEPALAEYSAFFQAMAGASATLIGLLFVAISVNPAAAAVDGRDVRPWIRAASALFALINVLAVSAFALLPGAGVGPLAVAGGFAAVVSSVGMIVISVRYRQWARAAAGSRWTRALVALRYLSWQLGLLVTYAAQAIAGLGIVRMTAAGTADDQPDAVEALLLIISSALIVMLLVAITRTWEAVGASMPRLLDLLVASRRPEMLPPDRRRDPDEPLHLPDDAGDAAEPADAPDPVDGARVAAENGDDRPERGGTSADVGRTAD
ncbi:hypothetical protein [Beutenbergia cavernae]|nr:hypothetical protein [Beutenbergia cavernae]